MAAPCRTPVVVILGATGTGKSKLSLELGRLFNGEIISADSMQVYKGLDIITNKVTAEEQQQCPHHVINYLSPLKQNSTIVDFRNKALPVIDCLLGKKKTPIIVGGTNYYIEALLWHFLIDDKFLKNEAKAEDAGTGTAPTESEREKLESASLELKVDNSSKTARDNRSAEEGGDSGSESDNIQDVRPKFQDKETKELHAILKEVDNVTAKKIHPCDRRKIIRALEVYHKHRVPMSNLYEAQHTETQSDKAVSGPLRYKDTCIFWIQCNQEVLNTRLDNRVDGMLAQGLVKELTDFHTEYNAERLQEGRTADYTRGIFQSIGFKEFHDYLLLSEEERQTERGKQLLDKGIEDLKLVTRRYARKQIRWIRNRFLKRPGANVPSVYGLDGSDVTRWEELVTKPATDILTALIQDREPEIKPLPYEGERETKFVYNECEVCDKVFVLEHIWKAHLSSKRHKALVKKAKILEMKKREELVKVTETLDQVIAATKSDRESLDGDGNLCQLPDEDENTTKTCKEQIGGKLDPMD